MVNLLLTSFWTFITVSCSVREDFALEILPIADCPVRQGADYSEGIMVLHPRRWEGDDVMPSPYSDSVYDRPVAMLNVMNLSMIKDITVDYMHSVIWFIELSENGKLTKVPLMNGWSNRILVLRNIAPHGNICLLIGRLSKEPEYRFRVGYLKRLLKNPIGTDSESCYICDAVYSNWFTIRADEKKVGEKNGAEL